MERAKKTLPSLFHLTVDERDSILQAADRLPLSGLNLTDNDLDGLGRISILRDDSLLVLLSLTVNYLFESGVDRKPVDAIINALDSLAKQCLGRALRLETLPEFPIVTDLGVCPSNSFSQAREV